MSPDSAGSYRGEEMNWQDSDKLARLYTGIVYDVMRERGLEDRVLGSSIAPLTPGQRVAAPVFTMEGRWVGSVDPHESLLAWTHFLESAPAGSVVVCQPNDAHLAHMGELSAETLAHRDVRGFIVDGGCRDTRFITEIGFPVWCRYRTPADIVGRWLVEAVGAPVEIDGVRVCTNDFVLADDDGVVVIPGEVTEEVIDEASSLVLTENKVRKAILGGVGPKQAYLEHGKF